MVSVALAVKGSLKGLGGAVFVLGGGQRGTAG
jgi:hypothetical protein